MIGTILGHYLILKKIRQGGKVDVFLAQDTNLSCLVILKLLTAEMYQEEAAARRYIREARAAAALDHPNVCRILEVGKVEGKDYIAMEFVDGDTLSQILMQRPLPFQDALEIAGQVAHALEAAHTKGITHRNLKPANILVSLIGDVKVADFGLVTQTVPSGGIKVPKGKVFVPVRADQTGGAMAYMSPEQLRGKKTDLRTDLFSFGIILFQLFSGVHPFHKERGPDIPSAILSLSPPPLAELCPNIPRAICTVVDKLLAKEPANRCASIGEFQAVLAEASSGAEPAGQPSRILGELRSLLSDRLLLRLRRISRVRPKPVFWIFSSALILTCMVIWILVQPLPQGTALSSRPLIPLSALPSVEDCLSISPDGRRVAFRWKGENQDNWDIYVRELDGSGLDRVTKLAAEDCCPAWSPDGSQLAFLRRQGERYAISLVTPPGDDVRVLGDVSSPCHLSWAPDGRSIAFSDSQSPGGTTSIWSLVVDKSARRGLTTPKEGQFRDDFPAYSPDGRYLAFVRRQNATGQPALFLMSLPDGQPKRLTDEHSPTSFAWTGDGREIVYSSGPESGQMALWRISADGGDPIRIEAGGDRLWGPSISGNRIVCLNTSADRGIWRVDLPGDGSARPLSKPLLMTPAEVLNPSISPNGSKIAFVSLQSGSSEVWTCNSNGSFPVRVTDLRSRRVHGLHWSPDGSRIAFDSDKSGNSDIYVVEMQGFKVQRITTDSAADAFPSWSRDGRWIYFGSNRSGTWQIWKVPAEGGKETQVTKEGGMVALESTDGRYLYYSAHPEQKRGIWRVSPSGGPEALESEAVDSWNSWTLTGRGLYFLNKAAEPSPLISFYEFSTREARSLARLIAGQEFDPNPGVNVSPDEKWLVYCGAFSGYEIFTVDNFR